MAKAFEVYEVVNPSFGDMNIEQQIDAGINDWLCRDAEGHEFFGQSKSAAIEYAAIYNTPLAGSRNLYRITRSGRVVAFITATTEVEAIAFYHENYGGDYIFPDAAAERLSFGYPYDVCQISE